MNERHQRFEPAGRRRPEVQRHDPQTPCRVSTHFAPVREPARVIGPPELMPGSSSPMADLLVQGRDVLVSTVGPFVRWGAPAIEAAIDAGAVYIDSSGEPAFIRRVFEDYEIGRASCRE